MFFVISGFTIFSQLFQEGYGLKKFLLVRLTRLSLPYFPLLIALYLYANAGGTTLNDWGNSINNGKIDAFNLLAHLTYLSPYDIRWQNTIIGIEWTLGVEVFFYVFIGVLVSLGLITLRPLSLIVFGMASVIIFSVQWIVAKLLSLDQNFVHWWPLSYFPMFYLGALAFVVRRHLKNVFPDGTKTAIALHVGAMGMLALTFVGMLTVSTFRTLHGRIPEAFFVVATFITIIAYRSGASGGVLCSRPLLFIGNISFSFYLLHYLVILLTPDLSASPALKVLLQLAISIGLSVVWCEIFEKKLYQRAKAHIKRTA